MVCNITRFSRVIPSVFIVVSLIFSGCASNQKTALHAPGNDGKSVDLPKLITSISATENENAVIIKIAGNQTLEFSSLKPFPANITLYFPDTTLGIDEPLYPRDSNIIASIKAEALTKKGKAAKVVIILKKDVAYEAKNISNGVNIILTKDVVQKKSLTKGNANSSKKMGPFIEKNKKPAPASSIPAWVNRIDFSSERSGKSTIIIGTSVPVKYKINKISDKLLSLVLFNTKIHAYRERPLITTRFQSAVNRIIPVRSPSSKNTTLISIELRESVPYFIDESNNLLYIHFDKSTLPPQTLKDSALPPWQKVLTQSTSVQTKNSKTSTPSSEDTLSDFNSITDEKKYTGEKIALDFYETDIKNVFKILQNISGKNFAIDDDVSGKVTLSFEEPVPWDQVLDLVLKMNHLGRKHEGNIIWIATLDSLLANEEARKKALKSKQDAVLQEDLVTEFIPVNYAVASDVAALIDSGDATGADSIISDRGTMMVDRPSNTIIITDVPESIKRAKKIVDKIDTVIPQVLIEARIVEVDKGFDREFGLNWNISGGPLDHKQLGNLGGYVEDPLAITPTGSATGLLYGVAMNAGQTVLGIDFARLTGTSFLLDAQLLALETNRKAKIISCPKVITANNETAKITQGVEFPFLERDESGLATVKFKDIDMTLEVRPHITADGRISMIVKIEKNDLSGEYLGVPILSTKTIETNLIADNGGTVVIGGIIQSSKTTALSGTPWLSKIPYLGWLFKIRTNADTNTELLIFITPKIQQIL